MIAPSVAHPLRQAGFVAPGPAARLWGVTRCWPVVERQLPGVGSVAFKIPHSMRPAPSR